MKFFLYFYHFKKIVFFLEKVFQTFDKQSFNLHNVTQYCIPGSRIDSRASSLARRVLLHRRERNLRTHDADDVGNEMYAEIPHNGYGYNTSKLLPRSVQGKLLLQVQRLLNVIADIGVSDKDF